MEKSNTETRRNPWRAAPALIFLPAAAIVAADQLSKAWIVRNVPQNTIASKYLNDFFWIVHARNLGIAFSIGDSMSALLRALFFVVVPACFLAAAAVFNIVSRQLTLLQRYAISVIIGGGLGNLIDRIFRPEGVVDFLSFAFFGLFGLERFPTFNIADMSVTIGAALLIISGFFEVKKEKGHDEGS